MLAAAACSPEQSRNIGAQPKKIIDKATTDVNQSIQQGADRTRQADEKQDAK